MHLIVTRPQADSERLKARIDDIGQTATVMPLLTIEADSTATIPDKAWQAIAVTSANALSALTTLDQHRKLLSVPVFAVGPASARLARDTGFKDVRQSGGDLNALQTDMLDALDAGAGPVLYLTGKVRSGDLAGALEAAGFTVDRIELYDAIAATQLTAPVKQLIRSGKAGGVVLYSARTADTWVRLVRRSRLTSRAGKLVHFCLSAAVAEKVTSGLGRNVPVVIAAKPDDDTMLETIAATAADHTDQNALPGKGATMANRKTPSRKARKKARPTVIDAKATEVKTETSASPGTAPDSKPGGKPDTKPVDKDTGKPRAVPDSGTGNQTQTAKGAKPAGKSAPEKTAPQKTSSGKDKLLAGALVVTLLAGVAAGGYLYREHGARLFGPATPALDVEALQTQAKQTADVARSASDTAAEALTGTRTLTEKLAGLEQRVSEAGSAAPAPDPDMLASISAASELARTAATDIAALTARTADIDTTISEVRQSVADLKSALQSAAQNGGDAGQAEINLKLDALTGRIDKLAAESAAPDQAAADEIATLREQLAAASDRIEKLEAAGPAPQTDKLASDMATITSELTAATARISDLEGQLADALAKLQSDAESAAQAKASAVDTARVAGQMAALADTVNTGNPFQAELAALQDTASLTLNLPALNANAATGIPTLDQLKQSLGDLKAGLDTATSGDSQAAGTSPGLWGTITGKLSSVVKVRKVTGATDWAAQATAAQAALETGGVDAAIAALDQGGASAPKQVSDWIIEARKRLAADRELQQLPQLILGQLPAPAQ